MTDYMDKKNLVKGQVLDNIIEFWIHQSNGLPDPSYFFNERSDTFNIKWLKPLQTIFNVDFIFFC